jgi:Methyltransferase FkbM domain
MLSYESLPPLARVEWNLGRYALAQWFINHFCHLPRFLWYSLKYRSRSRHGIARFEKKVYSQHGEDGIIEEIFRRIGEGGKYAVEIGIEDGRECCTRNLVAHRGWGGLLVEGGPKYAEIARQFYASFPKARVTCAFVTKETIVDLLGENEVPKEPDLLVIDIDGNDYWVLQGILAAYKPRVIVVEYNGRWTPGTDWVMPYDPAFRWRRDVYYGASLAAFVRLCLEQGYKLVGCESWGVNAFFVRADDAGGRFPEAEHGVAYHFAPPRYARRSFGHPVRGYQRRVACAATPKPDAQ